VGVAVDMAAAVVQAVSELAAVLYYPPLCIPSVLEVGEVAVAREHNLAKKVAIQFLAP
jgi:hypothetical protein